MRSWVMLALLGVVAIGALFGLQLLTPSGPTGNAIAPPTHWIDGSQVLIKATQLDAPLGPAPVRLTVEGDLVWKTILVNGEAYELTGKDVDRDWLSDTGTAIVRLPSGEHVVHAYSCLDTFTGYKCGCVNPDNCGNFMERRVVVE